MVLSMTSLTTTIIIIIFFVVIIFIIIIFILIKRYPFPDVEPNTMQTNNSGMETDIASLSRHLHSPLIIIIVIISTCLILRHLAELQWACLLPDCKIWIMKPCFASATILITLGSYKCFHMCASISSINYCQKVGHWEVILRLANLSIHQVPISWDTYIRNVIQAQRCTHVFLVKLFVIFATADKKTNWFSSDRHLWWWCWSKLT